jgi:uncharacterized protein YjiS (DUF1127 family)
MSAIEITSASATVNTAAGKPRTTVAQLFLRAVLRWQRNRASNELWRLDDRQLEDIGISRNDIPRVVEGLIGPEYARAEPLLKGASATASVGTAVTSFSRAA